MEWSNTLGTEPNLPKEGHIITCAVKGWMQDWRLVVSPRIDCHAMVIRWNTHANEFYNFGSD